MAIKLRYTEAAAGIVNEEFDGLKARLEERIAGEELKTVCTNYVSCEEFCFEGDQTNRAVGEEKRVSSKKKKKEY